MRRTACSDHTFIDDMAKRLSRTVVAVPFVDEVGDSKVYVFNLATRKATTFKLDVMNEFQLARKILPLSKEYSVAVVQYNTDMLFVPFTCYLDGIALMTTLPNWEGVWKELADVWSAASVDVLYKNFPLIVAASRGKLCVVDGRSFDVVHSVPLPPASPHEIHMIRVTRCADRKERKVCVFYGDSVAIFTARLRKGRRATISAEPKIVPNPLDPFGAITSSCGRTLLVFSRGRLYTFDPSEQDPSIKRRPLGEGAAFLDVAGPGKVFVRSNATAHSTIAMVDVETAAPVATFVAEDPSVDLDLLTLPDIHRRGRTLFVFDSSRREPYVFHIKP